MTTTQDFRPAIRKALGSQLSTRWLGSYLRPARVNGLQTPKIPFIGGQKGKTVQIGKPTFEALMDFCDAGGRKIQWVADAIIQNALVAHGWTVQVNGQDKPRIPAKNYKLSFTNVAISRTTHARLAEVAAKTGHPVTWLADYLLGHATVVAKQPQH